MNAQPTLQRAWVPIVREAIRQFMAENAEHASYEVEGFTVLVDTFEAPEGHYKIGLYQPGSTPEGTCDGYYICTADGETVDEE